MNRFFKSVAHAVRGLREIWSTEPNFRIEFVCGLLVLCAARVLLLSRFEWIVVLILVFGVLLCEIANAVCERIINILSPRYTLAAKAIKDMMAGMTLVASIASVIIGLWIFIPHLT